MERKAFARKEEFVAQRDKMIAPLLERGGDGEDPYVGSLGGGFATTAWWRVLLNMVGVRTFDPATAGSTPERFSKVNDGAAKWM